MGEWVGQPGWSGGDTVVWHFDVDGTAYRRRIRAAQQPEPLGHWWAYEAQSRPPRRFVCFEYGRERGRPACRYFAIVTLVDTRGHGRMQLELLESVEGHAEVLEAYAPRTP